MDEFPQDYEIFDLGDVTLQGGATLRDAKLAYKTYGELNADKSNAIVYPTWYSGRHWDNEWLIGDGMALDPAEVLHHRPEHARQRAVELAEQHASAVRQGALPERHVLRPGAAAAQARHREVRDRDAPARDRLVDGRRPDLPVGGQLPRHGPAGVPVLRLVEDERAQHRVPGGRQGGADRRRRVQGRLVRREAGQGPARRRARLRRLGLLAGLLLGPGLQGDGLLDARGLPRRVLGGLLPRPPRPEQPADDAVDLAAGRHRQHARLRRRPHQGAAVDQGQDDRRCRPRRTCTSRPRTRSTR